MFHLRNLVLKIVIDAGLRPKYSSRISLLSVKCYKKLISDTACITRNAKCSNCFMCEIFKSKGKMLLVVIKVNYITVWNSLVCLRHLWALR